MTCLIQKIAITYNSVSVPNLLLTAQICTSSQNSLTKLWEPSKLIIVIFVCMCFTVEISGIASSALLAITVLDVSDSETRIIVFSINNIHQKTISKSWKKLFSICKKQGSGGNISLLGFHHLLTMSRWHKTIILSQKKPHYKNDIHGIKRRKIIINRNGIYHSVSINMMKRLLAMSKLQKIFKIV